MADREILEIEELEHDYNVNQYTIRYDTDAQRFFKSFAPKAGYGAATAGIVFAGLSIATLATGGVLGLGLAAGVSAGVGAFSQGAYALGLHLRNTAKSRFKNMGIGGKDNSVGTIDLIMETEKETAELVNMLESQPNTKSFTVDGKEYSRRALKREIKENESVVYHGLKYILEQGLLVSDKINSLSKRSNLAPREENALNSYYEIMDRIAKCTKYVASQRSTFNPYKNLIVNSMVKGCLIGANDNQNNQIRLLKNMKEKDNAFKLYSNMFEMPIRAGLLEERKATKQAEIEIGDEYRLNLQLIDQLIKYDFDISRIKAENRAKAKELMQYQSCIALIGTANILVDMMPAELNAEKQLAEKLVAQLKNALIAKDRDAMKDIAAKLADLLDASKDKITKAYYNKGYKARKVAFDAMLAEFKQQANELKTTKTKLTDTKQQLTNTRHKLTKEQQKSAKTEAQLVDAWAESTAMFKQHKSMLNAYAETVLDYTKTLDLKKKPILGKHINFITTYYNQSKLSAEEIEQYELSLNCVIEAFARQAKTSKEKNWRLVASKWAKRNEIKQLKQQNATLTEDVAQVSAERDEAVEYLMNTTHELVKAERKGKEAEAGRNAAEAKLRQVEDELDRAAADLYSTAQAEEVAYRSAKILEGDLTDAGKKAAKAEREAEQANKRARSATRGYKKANERAKASNDRADAAEDLASTYLSELYDLEQSSTLSTGLLTSYLTDEEKKSAELTRKIADEKKKTATARKSASDARSKAKKDKERAKLAEQAVKRLEAEIAEKDAKIIDLEDHTADLVRGQGENIQTIIDLTVDNEELTKKNALLQRKRKEEAKTSAEKAKKNEELIAQLYYDKLKMEEELAGITADRDRYARGVDELVYEKAQLAQRAEKAEQDLDKMKEEADYATYWRNYRRAVSTLEKKVNKYDAHARITSADSAVIQHAVDNVMQYVDIVRSQDLYSKSEDELKDIGEALTVLYECEKKNLAKISKSELTELGKILGKAIKAKGKGRNQ